MTSLDHPAWPWLVAALVAAGGRPAPGRLAVLAAGAASLALAWALPEGGRVAGSVMGLDLVWLRADRLGRVFAIVFALIGTLGGLYALPAAGRRLRAAAAAATAAGLGVVLAGDWITLYVAWELLALASWALVLDGGPDARAPAFRYLLVHLAGGTLLVSGIAWHRARGGGALVEPPGLEGPGLLILAAFAVNAAIPPLHAWLTDAYPESSPAGSVFLSAFATKAAVYALARTFAGTEALVWAGTVMALYGVTFAVLENNIRRLLAYHIVSQVGYMVAGVGLGSALALNGAAAHAFSHILYKGLLFMGAGAVVSATGRGRLTELGGLGRAMPATLALYMVGALSISGAPLLNGFISKSMVVAAAEEAQRGAVAWLLHLAAVGTFLSVGLKLPWFTFAGRRHGPDPAPVPAAMRAAMVLTALLCAATGVVPDLLYDLLPHPVAWRPYSTSHVLEALQLLAATALGFGLLRDRLAPKPAVTLDTDRLWRAAGRWVARALAPTVAAGAEAMERAALGLTARPLRTPADPLAGPIGYAVLLAVAALGLALAVLAAGR